MKALVSMFQNLRPLDKRVSIRLELIQDPEIVKKLGIGSIGDSLKINASHCLVAIIEDGPGAKESVGFLLEQVVLYLQDKGVSF